MTEPTNNETALATSNAEILDAHSAITNDGFDLSALPASEQLEIVREILDAEATLESMALPAVNSRDILNVEINIVDASFRTIQDESIQGDDKSKVCVNFVCQRVDTGELFTVLKGSNAFNDAYANRFTKLRGIASKPLLGYEFVEDARWHHAGNNSIVLRRKSAAQAATKSK